MTIANGSVRLADADKKRLKSTVLELRRLLEADLARELKRLGIDSGRDAPLPADKLPYLSEVERAARRGLDAALLRERSTAGNFAAAAGAVRREAAYTHLNRLIGLKCLELRRHLRIEGEPTETITCRPEYGGRPKWLWALREREGRYRYGEDAEELLWREGLTQACAAVTEEIRVLFDPADPYAQVWPSHKALREAVDKLNSLTEDAFRADELLGWVYQYFQSEEKDRVFEAARTQKKKISGPDIIPVTQLYTEHYMVDFLLQNSLGALWMEMYPDSELKAEWPYYVTPATPHTRPRKPVREWTLLDPCAGSGHFLVVAFELFLRLYAEERRLAAAGIIPADWIVPEEEVAVTILERNLHGIDIDPRAVQLATLALYLKAKEAGLSRSPRINIVAADASFLAGDAWARFVESFKDEPGLQRILQGMAESLADIRELGSLLRPEVELQRIVREVHGEWETKSRRKAEQALLFPELAAGMQLELPLEELTDEQFWELMTRRAEKEIHRYVDAARRRGEAVDQVVAGEAERGFAVLTLCRQRYDIVSTNPPYMGASGIGEALREFVEQHYHPGRHDLCTAFILRCRELTQDDGYMAMVTQQSWMFLRSFAALRALPEEKLGQARGRNIFTGVLREMSLTVLAHLGPRAFSEIGGEVVSVGLFVLRNQFPASHHRFLAWRLLGAEAPEEKDQLLRSQPANLRSSQFQVSLLRIAESPIAYWLQPTLIDLLGQSAHLASQIRTSEGLGTRHDERFVRYWWEVKSGASDKWFPFVKGGGYAKWWGLNYWVVDYEDDGAAIKAHIIQRFPYLNGNYGWLVRDPELYGKPGLTFTDIAQGALGVRFMPEGAIFTDKGPAIFSESVSLQSLAAYLNSPIATYLLRALSPTLQFRSGYIKLLPPLPTDLDAETTLTDTALNLKQLIVAFDPIEQTFKRTLYESTQRVGFLSGSDRTDELLASMLYAVEGIIWKEVAETVGVNAAMPRILEEIGTPAGSYPLLATYVAIPSQAHSPADVEMGKAIAVLREHLDKVEIRPISPEELTQLRTHLHALYLAGPGTKLDLRGEVDQEPGTNNDSDQNVVAGGSMAVPAESFLEELSRKLKIHPISVYWLLQELRRGEGLICPSELKQNTEDYFSVKLLRTLGHRWPMQDQYEQEQGYPFLEPRWLDDDGIIPLTPGAGDVVLADRFARFLDAEFGEARGHAVEVEAGQILGWKPGDEWGQQKPTTLARWFEREFFRRHVSQFKRRPIAWHLSSPRGAFQVIVYYHKFDKNRLALLRARYVRNAIESLRHELAKAAGTGTDRATLNRVAALEAQLADVQEFDARLQRLQEGRDREARIWCPWKSPAEQPVGWDPDINDGVRVNIAPVQRLGLLAADVLAAKDVKSLLAPEGRG